MGNNRALHVIRSTVTLLSKETVFKFEKVGIFTENASREYYISVCLWVSGVLTRQKC